MTDQRGRYLVETLRPVARRLERIARSPPPGMSTSGMADVQFAFAQAMSTIGEQAGDNLALEQAVAAYRAALTERTRDRVPLNWAMTQTNIGTALLQRLGERESGTARLEEAAVCTFRAALEFGSSLMVCSPGFLLVLVPPRRQLGTSCHARGLALSRSPGVFRRSRPSLPLRPKLEKFVRADNNMMW